MLLLNQLIAKINALLSLKLVLALTILLSILGCLSVPVKKNREIWLIDNKDLVLYRVLDEKSEVAIPLSHKTATNFMCIHKDEFNRVVDDMVRIK